MVQSKMQTSCTKNVRRYRVFKRTKKQEDWQNFQKAVRNARSTCNNVYNTYVKQNFTENDDNKKIINSIPLSKQKDLALWVSLH